MASDTRPNATADRLPDPPGPEPGGEENWRSNPHHPLLTLSEVVMLLRVIAIALLGLYLMAVGIWPAAAAPVSLAVAGLAVLIGLVSGPVWALIVGVVWLWHRRTLVIQPATAWED